MTGARNDGPGRNPGAPGGISRGAGHASGFSEGSGAGLHRGSEHDARRGSDPGTPTVKVGGAAAVVAAPSPHRSPTGVDRNALIVAVLPDYHRWLHKTAYDLLPAGSPDHDDVCQEGLIAMWRAVDTFDESKGTLAPWITTAARQRMRDVAVGRGQWTGHEAMRGSVEAPATSLDAILDAPDEDDPDWLGVDVLDGVEAAYHDGQIAQAISELPAEQREYVFVRFWLGVDPSLRTPQMNALRKEFPVLAKKWLWAGSTNVEGARARLAEALAHLSTAA